VGDFTEDASDESNGGVVVPFDDRRSIRRIILREEHLSDPEEQEQIPGV
jgi:hypothetical protein